MLEVDGIQAEGRHAALIEPTTFTLEVGELMVVQAARQMQRTALGLVLTGRMAPDSGTVAWNGSDSRKALRKASALVDAPGINEMERHMTVRDYVGEMLSYLPHKPFRRQKPGPWLERNGLEDLDNLWEEQLTGEQRIRLMVELARQDRDADLLVVDTPSRHANHTSAWLPSLHRVARDEDHPRAVVAIVPHISDDWHGARAAVGQPTEHVPTGMSLNELFTAPISQEQNA